MDKWKQQWKDFDNKPLAVKLVNGHAVADLKDLTENYAQISEVSISASVSAPRIQNLFSKFVQQQDTEEEFFLFIEIPTNAIIEDELPSDSLHRDVYYLDGLNQGQVLDFLESEDFQILLHDGISYVGFGTKLSQSELGLYSYNIVNAFSAFGIEPLEDLFESLNIQKLPNLQSAWDFITKDNPGVSSRYSINDRDCYAVVEELKSIGLYFYKRRSE